MVHIPYRGSAPAFTDLMGGQVQFMAESIPAGRQLPQAGQGARAGRDQQASATPPCPTSRPSSNRASRVSRWWASTASSRRRPAQGRDRQTQRRLQAGAEQPRGPQPHGDARAPTRPLWAARTSRSSWRRKCRAGLSGEGGRQTGLRRYDLRYCKRILARPPSAEYADPRLVRAKRKAAAGAAAAARQTGAQNLYTSWLNQPPAAGTGYALPWGMATASDISARIIEAVMAQKLAPARAWASSSWPCCSTAAAPSCAKP
jgi:hypothetical protein